MPISSFCRTTRLAAVLAVAASSIAAHAETGQRGSAAEEARGAVLYVEHCQVCHRAGGAGEPPIPLGVIRPGYIVAMPLDETSHAWHHDDDQLVHTILSGNPRTRTRMPAFDPVLSEADARDIVAYLKTFWSDRIVACQGPKHMSCM